MTQAENHLVSPPYRFQDHFVSLLSGLVLGGMVAGFFLALVFGAEFAAGYFKVEALTTRDAQWVFYYLRLGLPALTGLGAAAFFYNFVLKLESGEGIG